LSQLFHVRRDVARTAYQSKSRTVSPRRKDLGNFILCSTVVGLPVELTRMSRLRERVHPLFKRQRPAPNSAASSCALRVALATSTERLPAWSDAGRRPRPSLPAPKIITVFADKSPEKTFSQLQATCRRRWHRDRLAVWVRISLRFATPSEQPVQNAAPVSPAWLRRLIGVLTWR